jgi:hypothetical protein
MVLLLPRSHHCQVVGHWNLALQLSHFLVSRYNAVVFNCSQVFNTVLSPSQCTIICQFVCWRSRASASHSLRALYYRFFLQLSQLGKLQCGICSLLFLSGKLVLQGTNASATLTASNSEWEWTWDFWRVQWLLVYQSTMAWHHEDPSRRSCTLWNNIFCTI